MLHTIHYCHILSFKMFHFHFPAIIVCRQLVICCNIYCVNVDDTMIVEWKCSLSFSNAWHSTRSNCCSLWLVYFVIIARSQRHWIETKHKYCTYSTNIISNYVFILVQAICFWWKMSLDNALLWVLTEKLYVKATFNAFYHYVLYKLPKYVYFA